MEEKYITINNNRYKKFFSNFDLENHIICDHEKKTFYTNGEDFTCRYCGKKKPEVSFRKKAHLIPQLLGNKYIVTKFECDECNANFGKYEESLASYLGFFRTLVQLKGQDGRGVPKFKNPKTGFEVYTDNKQVQVYYKDENNETIVNEEEKTAKIVTDKYSYIPLNVYKSILKIAIGLVDHNEIESYTQTLAFLKSSKYDNKLKDFPLYRMFTYFVPGPFYPKPAAFLYRRKESIQNYEFPLHTLLLFFRNHMYQIYLPFHKDDSILYQEGTINYNLLIAPIAFNIKLLPEGTNYTWNNIDLSSAEKKINEPFEINLKFTELKKEITA